MDRLVFSFALFPGRDVDAFGYYRDSCLKFIKEMSEAFEDCAFVAHLLDTVDPLTCKALIAAASGRVTIKRYSFPKKRGVCWLVSALRLRTLWEHGSDHTVIVADVHDDVRLQVKQIKKMIRQLEDRNAEVGLTYWATTEPDCVQHAALPVKVRGRHCHTDGGLIVWRPGTLRATANSGLLLPELHRFDDSGRRIVPARVAKRDKTVDAANDVVTSRFAAYCASAMFDVAEIPRGVDELLFDGYLSSLPGVELKRDPRVLMRQHVHKMAQQPRFYVDGDVASSSDSGSEADDSDSSSETSSTCSSSSSDDDHANCKAVLSSYKNTVKLGDAFPRSMFVDCGPAGSEVFYVCAEMAVKTSNKQRSKLEATRALDKHSARRTQKGSQMTPSSNPAPPKRWGGVAAKAAVNRKSPTGSSPSPSGSNARKRGRPPNTPLVGPGRAHSPSARPHKK